MKPKLYAELWQVIDKFIQSNAEKEQLPTDVFIDEELTDFMAKAAALAFDASISSAEYAERQKP